MPNIKKLSIAFLGTLVPDEQEYQNVAFRRSGNMVQEGIVNGFNNKGVNTTVFSLRPIASFPKDKKIFCSWKEIKCNNLLSIKLIPFINILLIKTITGVFYDFFAIIAWAIKNRNNERCIIVYNTYTPPLPFVYWISKFTRSKSFAILYDLGMPPKQLQLGSLKKGIYRCVEFFAKRYIPLLDGRIVINENMARDYAPGKHSLLVDGGISDNIISRLFELIEKKQREVTIFLLAGTISPINGTKLIRDTLLLNKNPNIRIWFAGNGRDMEFVKKLAKEDHRVEYKGMLDLDELFKLYTEVDVLMNLRVTLSEDIYLFPSKILEYLTIGKYVITTNVGHIKDKYGHLCKVLDNPSPEMLSLEIDKIESLSSAELLENGNNSRKYMIETHIWKIQSEKILNYILHLDKKI
jgi:glycosyltransferase involved in cell wall biosynthesis